MDNKAIQITVAAQDPLASTIFTRLPVDEVFRHQDLRRRQVKHDVPDDAPSGRRSRRLAFQDGVQVALQLLFGSLDGSLKKGIFEQGSFKRPTSVNFMKTFWTNQLQAN
jgi:hypothetical protein